MRVLVTGGAGLVARHLVRSAPTGCEIVVTWRSAPPPSGPTAHRVELSDASAVSRVLDEVRPDVVVHTAYSMSARSDVVDATAAVAAAAASVGAALVHLSSDMVFDGGAAPYLEDDVPAPVNDYGRWKLEAEQLASAAVPDATVTRTSLVVASDPPDHQTRWLGRALASGDPVTLFHDEYRTPVRADDLAAALWVLAGAAPGAGGTVLDRAERAGPWHLPGPERLSRAGLGRRVATVWGMDVGGIRTASAAEHPEPRPRDLSLASLRQGSLGIGWRPVPPEGAGPPAAGW